MKNPLRKGTAVTNATNWIKNPFRKGAAVTNATNFPVSIEIHIIVEDASGIYHPGPLYTRKLLGAGETILIGPEIYLDRMILLRSFAVDHEDGEICCHEHPHLFRDDARVLVRWNEETQRLELEDRGERFLWRTYLLRINNHATRQCRSRTSSNIALKTWKYQEDSWFSLQD